MESTRRLPKKKDRTFNAEFDRACVAVIRATNLLNARCARLRQIKERAYDRDQALDAWLAMAGEGGTH